MAREGLLNQLAKSLLETALTAELTEHLGHDSGGTPQAANMRNETRVKTVLTEISPVELEVSGDCSFEPVTVPRRKRRLEGSDQIALSLSSRGLATGEIAVHFDEIYDTKVSKDIISRMEKVAGELAEWSSSPARRALSDDLRGRDRRGP